MFPLRRTPPWGAPPWKLLIEITNLSVVPDSPLSSTWTVNMQDAPLFLQVPPKSALVPLTVKNVNEVAFSLIPAPGLV